MVTGSRPRLTISDYAEIIEGSRQPGQPQDVAAAPLAINGRIAGPNEVDRYRLPIVLVKLEGRSVAEAAQATGISQAAIKVGIHRGLKKLAAIVAKRR